jgi:hypothetical protein
MGFGLVALDHRGGFHVCNSIPKQIMANNTDTLSACRWYHLAGVWALSHFNINAAHNFVCSIGVTSIFFCNLTQNQTAFIFIEILRHIQLGSIQGSRTV